MDIHQDEKERSVGEVSQWEIEWQNQCLEVWKGWVDCCPGEMDWKKWRKYSSRW